jgi:2-polyprenyl-6-methoxyphenol hydroxylase-like FAD-dependent oxidoreductase
MGHPSYIESRMSSRISGDFRIYNCSPKPLARNVKVQERFWTVHRADYQQVLYEGVRAKSVITRLGNRVVSVDDEHTAVVLQSGARVGADLIVRGDGMCKEHPNDSRTLSASRSLRFYYFF